MGPSGHGEPKLQPTQCPKVLLATLASPCATLSHLCPHYRQGRVRGQGKAAPGMSKAPESEPWNLLFHT